MRVRRFVLAFLACCSALVAPAAAQSVGSGASSALIQQGFINAYFRGRFSQLVTLPPLGNVRALGSPGLFQEFQSATNSSAKLALIKPDPNEQVSASDTLQVYADIYGFYTTVGVSAAGYPTMDTAACPANSVGTCNYQLFSKNVALFVFSAPFPASYSISEPFYTQWSASGGLSGSLGMVSSAPAPVVSVSNIAGTQQLFVGGGIFSYPASSATPSTYKVSGGFYTAFLAAGGVSALGFPTGDEIVLVSGLHRQLFEKGRIEGLTGSEPAVLFPLREISVQGGAQNLSLALGATATLTASLFDTRGTLVTGRVVSWSTSNGSAVTVQANGATATIKAVGPGVANIFVTGEGITSAPLSVRVNAPCCAVGEGAPTQAMTQAFQDALSRNRLTATLPNASPVTRTGNGYIQALTSADLGGAGFAISQADGSGTAYVVSGQVYTAYLAAGGFAGPLGYPSSDGSARGTQFFVNGAALTGASPVRLVPAPIGAKWRALGAETGSLGAAIAEAVGFVSAGGVQGRSQVFASGTVFGMTSGSRAGQAFYSAGPILARYLELSGPAGALGTPVQDPSGGGGVQVQQFEAGYIDLQPGSDSAIEHFTPRRPAISVSPGTAAPGGKVHIGLTGFALGASLTVSLTSQPDFTVNTPGGEFAWDVVIPGNARPATVTIRARAAGSADTVSGTYNVTSAEQLQPSLTVLSGDQQTGFPGSVLAAPLVAVLRDSGGNPLPGVAVGFTTSPGSRAQARTVTDENGRITARLRLPAASGVAGLTISAAGRVASFSALAAGGKIAGVPAFSQASPQGSRTAAMAALIRYYQNSGTVGSPNGFATAAGLAQFLTANNGFTPSDTSAAILNPWIATRFAGLAGGIAIENPAPDTVRDLLNAGSPLWLDLKLTVDGADGGSTAVNAVGVNGDASVAILDPNPDFGRASLTDYLDGFEVSGHLVRGTVAAAIRLAPLNSAPLGFVVGAPIRANGAAASAAGGCPIVDLTDPASAGQVAPGKAGGVRFLGCDGAAGPYQVDFASLDSGASVYDLAGGPAVAIPNTASAWQVGRNGAALAVTPLALSISSVVNAAGYGAALSPGGIFAIFGQGLSAGTTLPTVTVNNQPAAVIGGGPFQINARMPLSTGTGKTTVQVAGALGTAALDVEIRSAGPGIFVIGTSADGGSIGAIVNQDGSINDPGAPVLRGQFVSIYGTGLGATVARQNLQVATAEVKVLFNGAALTPSYAGLTPGIAGLYQVNFAVPAATPPGVFNRVALQAAGEVSNTVPLAVQ